MIKFFRRIRRQLLAEGKTTRYLKYAIGEILLVMIGILLALQVNTWNEARKDRNQEQLLLKQLQTEFNSNLQQLDEKIFIRREIMNSASSLLGYIDGRDTLVKDSVNRHISLTIGYTTFDPIVSDLANSGGLKLLKNNTLKQLLSVWTSEVIQLTESEQTWYWYRNQIYLPFIIEHYQLRTARNELIQTDYLKKYQSDKSIDSYLYRIGGIGQGKYPEDYEHLLNQPDFEDHLTRCIITNNIADIQSIILHNNIVEILELIDSEIEE